MSRITSENGIATQGSDAAAAAAGATSILSAASRVSTKVTDSEPILWTFLAAILQICDDGKNGWEVRSDCDFVGFVFKIILRNQMEQF
jgi:hypothetical protein